MKGFKYTVRDSAGRFADSQDGYDTPFEAFNSAAESIRMFAESEDDAQSVTVHRVDADGTETECETRTGYDTITCSA